MKKSCFVIMRDRIFIALLLVLTPLLAVGQRELRPKSLHTTVLDGIRITYSVPRVLRPELSTDGKSIRHGSPARVYIAHPVPPARPLRIPPPAFATGGPQAASSTFSITYIPNGQSDVFGEPCFEFPAEARAAVEAAAAIWGSLVQSSVPITIKIGWADMAGYTIGYSVSGDTHRNFSGAPNASTWYESSLANALHGSDLSPDGFDLHITYNKNFPFYLGTDGNTPYDELDLMTIILHEIAHGLNFGGSMDYSGGQGSWGVWGDPNIYDTFLRDESGNALTNTAIYPNPSATLGSAFTSASVWFHGTNAMFANNGQRVKLYAPSTWAPGTSLLHLDYTTYRNTPNRLMVHSIQTGTAVHNPGPVTKGLLTDLGWTFSDYSSKAITGFDFLGLTPDAIGQINEGAHTIALTVPYGTNITALIPTIAFTGLSVSPAGGTAQNFTSPVPYTVTAADASTQVYTVTVTVASQTDKAITAFNFNGLSPAVVGVINEGNHTVSLTVPYGTDVTALVPSISIAGTSVSPAGGVAKNFTNPVIYTVTAADASTQAYTVTVTFAPHLGLSKTSFNFGSVQYGTATPAETSTVSNSGGGTLNWTAISSAGWLSVTPGTGTGAGVLTIGIADTSLAAGTYQGTVTVVSPNATNSPRVITVNFQVYEQGADSQPFGMFDTPTNGSTVASSIPVTGWALDDIGMQSVKIYRGTDASDRVFVGDAMFVEGARPDVAGAYPSYPQNTRAGWGYMLLTNFLPNSGNGTFTLLAYAVDLSGREVLLGQKTIICDNANAVLPFGAIDTPTQGGTASGAGYFNFGWALTPMPNSIPTDGSTLTVWVDGVPLGHPTYNYYRADIATLFPAYVNSNGAIGLYSLNTTTYTNAVHTIVWSVVDSGGNADGIGSRYFSVQNIPGGPSSGSSPAAGEDPWNAIVRMPEDARMPVFVRRGMSNTAQTERVVPEADGALRIAIPEVTRIAVYLNEEDAGETEETSISRGVRILSQASASENRYEAFQVFLGQIRPLPTGASFDSRDGVLYWQPGPGFLGEYELIFVDKRTNVRRTVQIHIHPR